MCVYVSVCTGGDLREEQEEPKSLIVISTDQNHFTTAVKNVITSCCSGIKARFHMDHFGYRHYFSVRYLPRFDLCTEESMSLQMCKFLICLSFFFFLFKAHLNHLIWINAKKCDILIRRGNLVCFLCECFPARQGRNH